MGEITQIYVDMDGVVADFVSATLKLFGREDFPIERVDWDYYLQLGMTEREFWDRINSRGVVFWAKDIQPYPWISTLLKTIEDTGRAWWFATTPSKHSSAFAGKYDWLSLQFGGPVNNCIMLKDKSVLAKPGALLIDDNDSNCERFVAAGGQAILFPQPWNKDRGNAGNVDLVINRLKWMCNGRKTGD